MNIEIMCFIWFACTSVNNNTCLKLRYVVSSSSPHHTKCCTLTFVSLHFTYHTLTHVRWLTDWLNHLHPSRQSKKLHWNKCRRTTEQKKKQNSFEWMPYPNDISYVHKKCVYLRFRFFFFSSFTAIARLLFWLIFISFRSWFTFWVRRVRVQVGEFFFLFRSVCLCRFFWWTKCYSFWPLVSFGFDEETR